MKDKHRRIGREDGGREGIEMESSEVFFYFYLKPYNNRRVLGVGNRF